VSDAIENDLPLILVSFGAMRQLSVCIKENISRHFVLLWDGAAFVRGLVTGSVVVRSCAVVFFCLQLLLRIVHRLEMALFAGTEIAG